MTTKINKISQLVSKNAILFASWMAEQGISRSELAGFVRSKWLERLATGVYYFTGNTPILFSAISSYNSQLKKKCVIGASTALDLKGFSHYGMMGKPVAYLFTTKTERLPKWFVRYKWNMEVRYFTTSIFSNKDIGIEKIKEDDNELLVSFPERAFMECLWLSPSYFSLMDLYFIMEMLTTLRPKLVQQLLEECTSVKVKRLFLYMAEKSGHSWFKSLNTSNIKLGKGTRLIAKAGITNSKYQITIPMELNNYE